MFVVGGFGPECVPGGYLFHGVVQVHGLRCGAEVEQAIMVEIVSRDQVQHVVLP